MIIKACVQCHGNFARASSRNQFCSVACARKNKVGPLPDRFKLRVNKDRQDRCWVWTGRLDRNGYGTISVNGKPTLSHRASWIIAHGEIQDGMCILHRCDNPSCVNPGHLFLGTQRDNVLDMISKGRGRYQREKAGLISLKENV